MSRKSSLSIENEGNTRRQVSAVSLEEQKGRLCFGTGAIMNIPNKSGSDIFISDGNQEFETLEKAIPISLKEEEGVNLRKKDKKQSKISKLSCWAGEKVHNCDDDDLMLKIATAPSMQEETGLKIHNIK